MKKAVKILMALFVSILAFTANAYAAEFTTSVDVQKNEKEYTVTLRIKEITADVEGINVFSTILSYNKDDFEIVKEEDITSKSRWNDATYSEETGKMLLFRGDFTKANNEEIIEIKLKQKENPKNRKTEISFTGTEAANTEKRLLADDTKIEVMLDKKGIGLKDIIIYILIGIAILLALRVILRTIIQKRRKVR